MEQVKRGDELDSRGNKRSKFWSVNNDPSETIQSQQEATDIKSILKRYGQVGIFENLQGAEAQYLDVSEFTDFGDVMRQAKEAELEFMKLPSKVREIFDHDVSVWLDTAMDKEKRDALVEAGLIERVADSKEGPVATVVEATGQTGGATPVDAGSGGGEAVEPDKGSE